MNTRVIDAGGRTVIPGLNDAHTHFIRGGLTYTNEVRWDGVPSLAEGMRRVREQARRTPAPHWVQVIGGWTWAQFAEKRFPTLDEINAATGDTPCMIMHLYDRAWLNRAAIRVLGWEKEVPKLFGGYIERDAGGNTTGLVMSTTSLASLVAVWLRVPRLSPEEQITSTRHFMREHNRLGVTSVIDAGGGGQNFPDNYAAIAKLAADNQLTLRIGYELFAQAPGKELGNYEAWSKMVKIGEGNDYYRMIGAGEYIAYSAGDPANFAKDWIVAPPGVMESQFTAITKFLAGLNWPFRQHTTFDATASRVLERAGGREPRGAAEEPALGPGPLRDAVAEDAGARRGARRQHQHPEPHVARRRGLPAEVRRAARRRRAADQAHPRDGHPARLRHRRQPRHQLQPLDRRALAAHRQDPRRRQAAGRPEPARPHRGAAPVHRGRRLDVVGRRQEGHACRPASSPTWCS